MGEDNLLELIEIAVLHSPRPFSYASKGQGFSSSSCKPKGGPLFEASTPPRSRKIRSLQRGLSHLHSPRKMAVARLSRTVRGPSQAPLVT